MLPTRQGCACSKFKGVGYWAATLSRRHHAKKPLGVWIQFAEGCDSETALSIKANGVPIRLSAEAIDAKKTHNRPNHKAADPMTLAIRRHREVLQHDGVLPPRDADAADDNTISLTQKESPVGTGSVLRDCRRGFSRRGDAHGERQQQRRLPFIRFLNQLHRQSEPFKAASQMRHAALPEAGFFLAGSTRRLAPVLVADTHVTRAGRRMVDPRSIPQILRTNK